MLRFIRILIADLKIYLSKTSRRANYYRQFPNSEIKSSALIIDSSLAGSNVLFERVTVICSSIDRHTYVQRSSSIYYATIGKFCSIASNVTIGPGIHKMDSISTHPSFYLKNTPLVRTFVNEDKFTPFKETIIGHDVWIGQNAVIMDGVNVGTGAVIASGAVVTKDVEPFAIMGGVPAKCIKYRFNKETASKILRDEWWLKSDEELEQNVDSLLNVSNNDTNC